MVISDVSFLIEQIFDFFIPVFGGCAIVYSAVIVIRRLLLI